MITMREQPEHDDLDDFDERGPSRSQQRRDALAVFELAQRLMALSHAELARMPMSDDLRDLVTTSQKITQHIARKRQTQFLAKHLRKAEDQLPGLRAALEHDRDELRRDSARLHRLERWRDRLIAEGDAALSELLREHPDADRQALRSVIRKAQEERDRGAPPAAARTLFKTLRELFEAGSDDDA
jgi:ribosome-associated protein